MLDCMQVIRSSNLFPFISVVQNSHIQILHYLEKWVMPVMASQLTFSSMEIFKFFHCYVWIVTGISCNIKYSFFGHKKIWNSASD